MQNLLIGPSNGKSYVLCEVQTEYLYIMRYILFFQGLT
jgi:hypothetical protein